MTTTSHTAILHNRVKELSDPPFLSHAEFDFLVKTSPFAYDAANPPQYNTSPQTLEFVLTSILRKDNVRMLKCVLNRGLDMDFRFRMIGNVFQDQSLFNMAANYNALNIVDYLALMGAERHHTNYTEENALILAAEHQHIDMVEKLVGLGLDINVYTKNKRSVLCEFLGTPNFSANFQRLVALGLDTAQGFTQPSQYGGSGVEKLIVSHWQSESEFQSCMAQILKSILTQQLKAPTYQTLREQWKQFPTLQFELLTQPQYDWQIELQQLCQALNITPFFERAQRYETLANHQELEKIQWSYSFIASLLEQHILNASIDAPTVSSVATEDRVGRKLLDTQAAFKI